MKATARHNCEKCRSEINDYSKNRCDACEKAAPEPEKCFRYWHHTDSCLCSGECVARRKS
jgi:hypothetical protein